MNELPRNSSVLSVEVLLLGQSTHGNIYTKHVTLSAVATENPLEYVGAFFLEAYKVTAPLKLTTALPPGCSIMQDSLSSLAGSRSQPYIRLMVAHV